MSLARRFAAVLLVGALSLSSCGGSPAEEEKPAEPPTAPAGATEAEPSPSSTYAFADYEFKKVTKGGCVETKALGEAGKLSMDIHRPKSGAGEFFYPNCLTNVKGDHLTVELANSGTLDHNFIVEGDDVELVVPAGKKGRVSVELGAAKEIGFQCTIHDFMFGAFFR